MKKVVAIIATGIMLLGPTTNAFALEMEHEVLEGDTLWGIANDYNTTVESLLDINELESNIIYPKQKLAVYKKYIVEKGDTLYRISKEHGVAVDDIKKWNELTSDLILVGQELLIQEAEEHKVVAAAQSIQPTEVKSSAKESNSAKQSDDKPEGKTIAVVATAYTAECDGCSGITYTGIDLNKDRNAKVIAVDPSVIPLGSKVYVEGYGYAIAGDIGSAIKGNRIDLHVPTKEEAYNWGVREVNVTIVE